MGVEQEEHVESECCEDDDLVHLFGADFRPVRTYTHAWSVGVLGSIFIVCYFLFYIYVIILILLF